MRSGSGTATPPPCRFGFLRAINVGGHIVPMARLRGLLAGAGLTDIETFLASGNVSFRSAGTPLPELERGLAAHLERSLGYPVPVFIRTLADLTAIARYRPFPDFHMESAGALNVGFVAGRLGAGRRAALLALRTDVDEFHASGRQIYWWCRGRQSDSKVSGPALERAIGTPTTFRNVRTIQRLTARYAPGAGG